MRGAVCSIERLISSTPKKNPCHEKEREWDGVSTENLLYVTIFNYGVACDFFINSYLISKKIYSYKWTRVATQYYDK